MKVSEVMTRQPRRISGGATLKEAAELMAQHNTGFLAISDDQDEKLEGVITDRDIVVRAVAKGLDPSQTHVKDAESGRVLYCFQDDDIETACKSMHDQHIYRLIVLDDRESKRLVGVVTLGDMVRHEKDDLAEWTVKGIMSGAA